MELYVFQAFKGRDTFLLKKLRSMVCQKHLCETWTSITRHMYLFLKSEVSRTMVGFCLKRLTSKSFLKKLSTLIVLSYRCYIKLFELLLWNKNKSKQNKNKFKTGKHLLICYLLFNKEQILTPWINYFLERKLKIRRSVWRHPVSSKYVNYIFCG